jgi:iron complex transport system substrate-binding protein
MTLRIVSLLPSATEIVCALGFESALVGRSHECDFPPRVVALPVLTESKVHGEVDSEAIHGSVTSILESDASVYRVHSDALRALRPTHIVTQIQCEVCAVSLRDVEAALADWMVGTTRIVALSADSMAGVYDDILRTASEFGSAGSGERLVAEMRARVAAIAARTTDISRPRVASIEWLSPLMAAGNWVPELIEAAGGENLFGQPGRHSSWMSWPELRDADPDVLLIFPCGYRIADSLRESNLLTNLPGWQDLRAVRSGKVLVIDGNQYLNRPGPRLVESLEILAEILHPERFHFGYENSAWQRLAA